MHIPSKMLAVTLVVLPTLACGGGDAGPGGAFCQEYAAAQCKKIYACPDPNVTITGTEAQCAAGFAKLCSDPPSGDFTSDVNCSGGKHVNTAARTACLDSLGTVTCADFNSGSYTNVCDQVCVTPTTGTGGSAGNDTGTGGSGGAAGLPASPTAAAFCANFNNAACDRAFACFTAAERDSTFTDNFGTSTADCKTTRNGVCPTVVSLCTTYSAADGNACVAKTVAVSCLDFKANMTPAECALACPQ